MVILDSKKIISSDTDGNIIIWDMQTYHITRTIITNQINMCACEVAISHDGKKIIFCSDSGIKIWCIETGHLLKTLLSDVPLMWSFTITFDGSKIITCSGKTGNIGIIQIWNLETYELLLTLDEENDLNRPIHVAVTSDGKKIISGTRDGIIKIWDSINGNCLDTFNCTSNNDKYYLIRSIRVSKHLIIVETSDNIIVLQPATIFFIENIQKYLKSNKRKLPFV